MLHTLCFVIGVSFAFFLLGLGFSAMGGFFKNNQLMFARVGGILLHVFMSTFSVEMPTLLPSTYKFLYFEISINK